MFCKIYRENFSQKIIDTIRSGKKVPLSQLIMFYLDDITLGGNNAGGFISIEKRLAEAHERHPEVLEEQWQREEDAANIAQDSIFNALREKGVEIEKPDDIPELITKTIESKYVKREY